MSDALGDRMKAQYEDRTRYFLPRRTYTMLRLDGKAFHSYTRTLKRPYDQRFMDDMDVAAMQVAIQAQGACCAYVQSDEISVLLRDFATITTEAWFDGNIQKIVSVATSIVTQVFNQQRRGLSVLEVPAHFDCRVFTIPDPTEVENYFIWRQQDAMRNSINMAAQEYYSHKELHGKNNDERQEMLFQKGINWNDYPAGFKRGRMILRTESFGWCRDTPPIFTQDREYLRSLIPRIL